MLKGRLVHKGHKELKDLWEIQVLRETSDHKEIQVHKVQQECREIQDILVHKVQQDHRGHKVMLGRKGT